MTAEQLYEAAKAGQRLSAGERRRVMLYLDEENILVSTDQLAKTFQVPPSVIRRDRQQLLQDYAAYIKPDAAMDYVARYLKEHDTLIAKLRKTLDSLDDGSLAQHNAIKLLSDLHDRKFKRLQDIGIIQKELGHLSVTEETWVAEVSAEGITSVTDKTGSPDLPATD